MLAQTLFASFSFSDFSHESVNFDVQLAVEGGCRCVSCVKLRLSISLVFDLQGGFSTLFGKYNESLSTSLSLASVSLLIPATLSCCSFVAALSSFKALTSSVNPHRIRFCSSCRSVKSALSLSALDKSERCFLSSASRLVLVRCSSERRS